MISSVQKKQLENLRSRWRLNSTLSATNRVAYVLRRSRENYVRVTGGERGLTQYQAECLEHVEGVGNHHEVARFERERVLDIIDKVFVNLPGDHVLSKLTDDFKAEIYGIFRKKPRAVSGAIETDPAQTPDLVLTAEQVPGVSWLGGTRGLYPHWSTEVADRAKKYATVALASTLAMAGAPASAKAAPCGPPSLYAQAEQETLQALTVSTSTTSQTIDPSDGFYFPEMRLPFPRSTISSLWGYRASPCLGCSTYHQGVDFSVGYGTKIPAVIAGTVTAAEYDYELGNYVTVDAGHGMEMIYAHMSSVAVSVGDKITLGQKIGKVGSTGLASGDHLHLAIKMYGELVDPLPILNQYVR